VDNTVVLVAFGAAWLVSLFLVRRFVIREVIARRMSIGTAAVILGLLFGVVPIPALLAFPDSFALIVFLAAALFVAAAGTTFVMARVLGLR
jgi:hypothetical protein